MYQEEIKDRQRVTGEEPTLLHIGEELDLN